MRRNREWKAAEASRLRFFQALGANGTNGSDQRRGRPNQTVLRRSPKEGPDVPRLKTVGRTGRGSASRAYGSVQLTFRPRRARGVARQSPGIPALPPRKARTANHTDNDDLTNIGRDVAVAVSMLPASDRPRPVPVPSPGD